MFSLRSLNKSPTKYVLKPYVNILTLTLNPFSILVIAFKKGDDKTSNKKK